MAVEILMPELGESVHEGTVSKWLKKEGEFVKEDEPVVEIMTDKVNTELPAPASGVLSKILIPEGGLVEVFKAMGIIEEKAASHPAGGEVARGEEQPAQKADGKKEALSPPPAPSPPGGGEGVPGDRRFFTPVVRAIAKEKGISEGELASIQGSGSGGRVTKQDVEAYIAGGKAVSPPPAPSPPRGGEGVPGRQAPASAPQKIEVPPVQPLLPSPDQELVPLQGMRKMIADHMVRSAAVPVVTTMTQVDVTTMVKFREANKEGFQEQHGVKLTYTPFFIKAITESLIEFPLVNASLREDDQIVMNHAVHMGIAVALGAKGDEGLIVPVIKDCDKKNLIEIARDLEATAKAARGNTLKPQDVQGGTFTLTNPGTYGALFGTPMINAPQAAIMGAYAITKMPVVVEDMIGIRSVMHLVLTYDHRIVDGLLAGRFLARVKEKLEQFDFFK